MMTNRPDSLARILILFTCALLLVTSTVIQAQEAPAPPAPSQKQTPAPDDAGTQAGPQTDNGPIIVRKKNEADQPPPPPAPAEPTVKNPGGANYSLRVDVPIVNLNVNVILDKTHQFVPGLMASNFLVLEDGVPQTISSVHITQKPITAVMLLEFAANSYYFINQMQNASYTFFQTLRPNDYVAVITYDLRTHILTDFTNNKSVIAEALQSLTIPGFSDTDMFDALYETLDRISRIEGQKYIILIGTGRDTFSKITLDTMLAKIKATPNVTIFTIGTGAFLNEMYGGQGGMGGAMRDMDYLQAENQLKTFAAMTGGLSFNPIFQGELPDIFATINNSIRNQYVLTYRPTNTKDDGSYRKIKVLLVDSEGHPLRMADEKGKPQKYSIIARDGYRAKLPVE
jgi:VWFA-related protein